MRADIDDAVADEDFYAYLPQHAYLYVPTRELWPAPYLVMDTGASTAPYNHFELGQPILIEYVWGRQGGENTINP